MLFTRSLPTLSAALAGTAVVLGAASASAQACPTGRSCYYVPPAIPAPPSTAQGWDIVLASPVGTISGTYQIGAGTPVAFSVSSGTPLTISTVASGTGVASGFGAVAREGVFIDASSSSLIVDQRTIRGAWQQSTTVKSHIFSLGTRFRLAGFNLDGGSSAETGYDYVSVYAPFGSTVTLTAPAGAVLPYWEGSETTERVVTLAAGQTVVVRTRPSSGGADCGRDITGALLTSTDSVSVSSGGRGWTAACSSTAGGCGDDGGDNLLPTSGSGTAFVLHDFPVATGSGEQFVVIADASGTEVRVDGALAATLGVGEVYRGVITGLTVITTSRPASVIQTTGLAGCETDIAQIPPATLADGAWITDFNVVGTGQVGVLIRTAQLPSLRVDGATPAFVRNEIVPGLPTLSAVRFDVSGGDHSVRADGDFQLGLVTATASSGLFGYYTPFRVAGCGDGTRQAGEGCDDSNVRDGDGCSATCRVEIGSALACALSDDCVPSGRCQAMRCVARCTDTASCNDSNPCTTEVCNTGTGTCDVTSLAAGTVCTGGVCLGGTMNRCVACIADTQCSGATPACNTTTHACVQCTRDAQCSGSTPVCNTSTNLCIARTGCEIDSHCLAEQFCNNASRMCVADLANGVMIPMITGHVPTLAGECSREVGAIVCASGVCEVSDDLCGLMVGSVCTLAAQCRSSICAASGTCGECSATVPCATGFACSLTNGRCERIADAGTDAGADAGADAGVSVDAAVTEDAATTFDAWVPGNDGGPVADARRDAGSIGGADAVGNPDAGSGTPGGGFAGGACSCAAAGAGRDSSWTLALGAVALVLVRRRRRA